MASCRSCGAPIRWTKTPQGRSMPLDIDPHPDGNVLVRAGDGTSDAIATVLPKDAVERLRAEGRTPLFRAHFSSCPEAKSWSKSKSRT